MLTCGVVQGIKYGSETTTVSFIEGIKGKPNIMLSTTTILVIMAATVPLSLILSPITVPLCAIVTPIAMIIDSTEGDVTPILEDGRLIKTVRASR